MFPSWKQIPNKWIGCFDLLQNYYLKTLVNIVRWILPQQGWAKVNTNGANKGNPGRSSYGFCVRDFQGDFIYAEADYIWNSTNKIVETTQSKKH